MSDDDDVPLAAAPKVAANDDEESDDAPLAAPSKPPLSSPQKRAVAKDDDTPLSFLTAKIPIKAAASKPKVKAAASNPKLPTKPVAPGKLKGAAKRKRDSDSGSSSSSSSSSSGSDSSDEKALDRRGSKEKLRRKPTGELGEGEKKVDKTKSIKEQVAAELLSRWWYVLPDWPPPSGEYYAPLLEAKSLRKVRVEEWEWVPEIDSEGRTKVYELCQFRGCFRNFAGDFIDLRPLESCPSFYNIMKKDLPELYDLLAKAYAAQIEDLKNSVFDESVLEASLKARLNGVREKAHMAGQIGNVKRKP